MATTLKNKSRQPVVLVLDHAAFANKLSGWKRTTHQFAAQTEQGDRVVSEVRRSIPGSLTILPGESATGLHDAVVHCAQVPELVAKGILEVIEEAEAGEAPVVRSPRVKKPEGAAVPVEKVDP